MPTEAAAFSTHRDPAIDALQARICRRAILSDALKLVAITAALSAWTFVAWAIVISQHGGIAP